MDHDAYAYVDVRSTPEYDTAHAAESYNIPVMERGDGGLVPNPDFMAVMNANFQKDAKFILACQSGRRSLMAAGMLEQAGYTNFVELRTGFDGAKDNFGGITEPGWSRSGLPVASGPDSRRGYRALRNKTWV